MYTDTWENIMKVIVHDRDADGYCAAACAMHAIGVEGVVYAPVQARGHIPPGIDLKWTDEMYVLDTSLTRAKTLELRSIIPKMVTIDHHQTSVVELDGIDGNVIDTNHATCRLAWDYFNPGVKVPKVVELVEDADLFKFKHEESKWLSSYSKLYKFTYDDYIRLMEDEDELNKYIVEGKTIFEKEELEIKDILAQPDFIRVIDWKGYKVALYNMSNIGGINSRLASAIYADDSIDLTMGYNHKTDIVSCSLRSNGKVDLSAVVKDFGGGGHKNAAGMLISHQRFIRDVTDLPL